MNWRNRKSGTGLDNMASATRMHDILVNAELSHQLGGLDRRTFLMRQRNGQIGAVRRELDRIIALGDRGAERFFGYYLESFGVYRSAVSKISNPANPANEGVD